MNNVTVGPGKGQRYASCRDPVYGTDATAFRVSCVSFSRGPLCQIYLIYLISSAANKCRPCGPPALQLALPRSTGWGLYYFVSRRDFIMLPSRALLSLPWLTLLFLGCWRLVSRHPASCCLWAMVAALLQYIYTRYLHRCRVSRPNLRVVSRPVL